MKTRAPAIAAPPAAIPRPAAERPAHGAAMAGLYLTMLMPSLATSIANAALPALARSFAASFQAAQWILLVYLLAVTTAIVAAGRLGDLFGRRRLLMAGIALFTAASLLCAAAPALPLLIAARGAQGLGAAVMMALTMALVGDTVPQARLGRTMGLLGTVSAVGTSLGPSLGGVMIAAAGWPSIFLVNVPLGLAALALVARALPADAPAARADRGRFEPAGTALLFGGLCTYTLAMTVGRGSFGPLNAGLLLAAIAAGVGLLRVEARAASPLIDPVLFGDRALRHGLVTSALVSTVMMATLVVGPFYLSGALGLRAAPLGFALSAGPLVAMLAGIPAGRLVDRIGSERIAAAGLLALLAGAAAIALAAPRFGVAGYVGPIMVMTSGYALFQAANNTAIMRWATPAQRGLVSALVNLTRNLGLITGASAMGAVFALGVAGDVVTAAPAAIALGTRICFAVAAALVALALASAVGHGFRTAGDTIARR